MEIRHLQALVAVAENGSFSAAADYLGTVQSNVSAHVARLERELGATLVERSGGRLTGEGEVVVSRAYRVLGELEALAADIAALREEVAGTVKVGLIGTVARWLVPVLLGELALSHPKLHLVVSEGTTTSLEPLLVAGRLDFAVLTAPGAGHDVVFEPLLAEDLVLVVPADADLTGGAEGITVEELAGFDLLLPAPGTPFRAEIDAAVGPPGVVLRPRAELDGVRLIASLVFEGYGPAVLPSGAVPPHLRERFRRVGIEGLEPRHVGLALRTRGMPSAPARAVLSTVRHIAADQSLLPPGVAPVVPDSVARAEGSLRALRVPNG